MEKILKQPPKNLVLAKQIAETSEYGNLHKTYWLGSVIATKQTGGYILSVGTNNLRSHPLQIKYARNFLREEDNYISTHSEIDAISRCRVGDLISSSIFVARNTKSGSWGNSRPCEGCMKAIVAYGISNVFFYEDGQFIRLRVSA